MTIISVQNIKINYIKSGKGQPLILLHGIFADADSYKELIRILSRYYTVYAIDLPMHGKSEKPKKYLSVFDISLILKEFITKLRIKNPVLCAHSAGCLIAIDYASKNRVKELILIEPAGISYYHYKISILFRLLLIKAFFNFIKSPMKALKIVKTGLYNLFRNMFNKNFWTLFNDNFKRDYSAEMKKIKCPTKLLWAKYDELFPFRYITQFQKKIKNSEIIPINGNHDWPILRPEEIYKSNRNKFP